MSMRVAVYNQMFGMNGKSFFGNIFGHWAVHYQKDLKKVWDRTNLEETVNTLKKSKCRYCWSY